MIRYVTDFGAAGDGVHDDTQYIQAAMDACAASQSGELHFPRGVYLTGGLRVPSNLHMTLLEGCVIKSCGDADRCIHRPGGFERIRSKKQLSALLYLDHADNVHISGPGVIDGNFLAYTDGFNQENASYIVHDYPRPEIIYAQGCRGLTITGIRLQQSPFWTIHLAGCENTRIDHIIIDNDLFMPNTDGIDVDRCRNTTIANCRISTADDGICPKLTEETAQYGDFCGLTVQDCEIVSHSSAIKFGSSSFGSFQDASFERIRITDSNRGLAFQLRDGGIAQNIIFKDITISTKSLSGEWWGCGEAIYVTAVPRDSSAQTGHIRNVRFQNVRCEGAYGIFVYADQPGAICNVVFEDVVLRQQLPDRPRMCDLRPCVQEAAPVRPLQFIDLDDRQPVGTDGLRWTGVL